MHTLSVGSGVCHVNGQRCEYSMYVWEHANKVLIKVIGKFVKLPQLFHFFVVNDLH